MGGGSCDESHFCVPKNFIHGTLCSFIGWQCLKCHLFPVGSDGKECVGNAGEPDLIPESGSSPGTSLFLPGEFQRSLADYSPWGHRVGHDWVTNTWTSLSFMRRQYLTLEVQVVLVVENLPASGGDARDAGSIPGSGKSPGVGNGTPLQYSCLESSTGREAWRATVHWAAQSQTWLSTHS